MWISRNPYSISDDNNTHTDCPPPGAGHGPDGCHYQVWGILKWHKITGNSVVMFKTHWNSLATSWSMLNVETIKQRIKRNST